MKRFLPFILSLFTLLGVAQNKAYITKVYDFVPAPGQNVNLSPKWEAGMTRADVIEGVEKAICGRETIEEGELPDGTIVLDTIVNVKPGLISLGSYGGYVVFGFDHPVVNVAGERDLQIFGNAFQADSSSTSGGSSEPGIVMVSRDDNGNGLPDDKWYELAGSEYANPRTQKHFVITYYKPDESKTPVPDPRSPFITDTEYVRWNCNSTDSLTDGYVFKNSFKQQSYWPQWIEGESLTFEGTKLPCNAANENTQGGEYWVQHFYDWGYVDNRPDYAYDGSTPKSNQNKGFDLDWAVDDDGNPVPLNKIHFVKVFSGVLQQCGWLGETSTEVCGAIDLHPNAEQPADLVRGDLNGDSLVDVGDVSLLIDVVLGKHVDLAAGAGPDLNDDGNVDVTDVSLLIDIVLGKG